jgi:hypothetical protein
MDLFEMESLKRLFHHELEGESEDLDFLRLLAVDLTYLLSLILLKASQIGLGSLRGAVLEAGTPIAVMRTLHCFGLNLLSPNLNSHFSIK